MRFLQFMLTVIWLSFGWLCFSALHWQKPMEPPWHAVPMLEKLNSEAQNRNGNAEEYLNNIITKHKFYLTQSDITGGERANTNYRLARNYWLLAYQQTSYVKQTAYLELAINELMLSLNYWSSQEFQSRPYISRQIAENEYGVADLHLQLKEYDKAEIYFLKAMKRAPGNSLYFDRYKNLLEESGFENKIDTEDYFSPRHRPNQRPSGPNMNTHQPPAPN